MMNDTFMKEKPVLPLILSMTLLWFYLCWLILYTTLSTAFSSRRSARKL